MKLKKLIIIIVSVCIILCILNSILKSNSSTYNNFLDTNAYNSLVRAINNSSIVNVLYFYNIEGEVMKVLESVDVDEIEKPVLKYKNSLWNKHDFTTQNLIEIRLNNGKSIKFGELGDGTFFTTYKNRTFKVECNQLKEFLNKKAN